MAAYSHPLIEDVLPPSGKVEGGISSELKGKVIASCGDGPSSAQRSFKRKGSYPFSARHLGVALVSLAVAYFLLQCYVLTKQRSRVASLARSIAAGRSRECRRDAGGEEYTGDDEDAELEDTWIGDVEGGAGEDLEGERTSGQPAWGTGHRQQWLSTGTVPNPSGFGGIQGLPSEGERLPAAEGEGIDAGRLGQLSFSEGRSGRLEEGDQETQQLNHDWRLLEGETLDMWQDRNLPLYAQNKLISLFGRMTRAVSFCQSLLPELPASQRLQFTYELMRLLALELGAITFVPTHLEHLRLNLGNVLVQLGTDAIKSSRRVKNTIGQRKHIEKLVTLINELKKPRPRTENADPTKYRKKTISILQTGITTVTFCLAAVEDLVREKDAKGIIPPSQVIEERIEVLKQLFNVHSGQVVRDSALRYYIIECQKSTKVYHILTTDDRKTYAESLPPLVDMMTDIQEAVSRVINGEQAPEKKPTEGEAPAGIPPRMPVQERHPYEPPSGARTGRRPRGNLPPRLQGSRGRGGVHLLQRQQSAASSLTLPHPRPPPLPLGPAVPQRHPAPLSQRFPHPGFNPVVALVHPQEYGIYGMGPQATGRNTGLQETMHRGHTLLSERGGLSVAGRPVWQEPAQLRQPFTELSRRIFVGGPGHMGITPYPRHGGYGISDQGAGPPLLPGTAGSTEHPSGGISSRDNITVPFGTSHQEEAEEEEELGSLLQELLKGGLDRDVVLGRGRRKDP